MGFLDFIQRLQQKPRHIKVQIMWAVVIVCMVIIFIGWVWSLGGEMKSTGSQASKEKGVPEGWGELKKDIPSLWQSLGAGIGNIFETAKEKVNDLKSLSATSSEIIIEKNSSSQPPAEMLPVE